MKLLTQRLFSLKFSSSGVALVVVVGLLFSLSIMALGLVAYLQTDQRDMVYLMDEEKAFFAAEGGLQKAIYYLNRGQAVDHTEVLGDAKIKLEAASLPGYVPITVTAQVARVKVRVSCLAEDDLLTPGFDFRCRQGSFARAFLK